MKFLQLIVIWKISKEKKIGSLFEYKSLSVASPYKVLYVIASIGKLSVAGNSFPVHLLFRNYT